MTLNFDLPSIISMLVITTPWSPLKIIFFNQAIADPPRARIAAAAQVAVSVLVVLGGAALVGRELLDLTGISLSAFTVVGGLVIFVMGAEMMYGGAASKAQGQDVGSRGPEEGDSLVMPLTSPLIAGPGAISTTIAVAANGSTGVANALAGALCVAGAAFISYAFLGGVMGRLTNEVALRLFTRLGGLVLMAIGVQMLLRGLGDFYAG